MLLLSSTVVVFQNQLFQKILSGIPPECQTAWIQIRPNMMSGLIWVQTVCKGYQQTILEDKRRVYAKLISQCTLIYIPSFPGLFTRLVSLHLVPVRQI